MAYAYVASSSQGQANGGALTVAKPTGTGDGDLILVLGYLESDTNSWSSVGAGFVNVAGASIANTGAFRQDVWWKVASGEGASWTWTPTTNGWRAVVVVTLSGGTGASDRVDAVWAGQGDAAASVTITGVSTSAANDLLAAFAVNWQGTTYSITSSEAGLAKRVDLTGTAIFTLDDAGAAGAKANTVVNAGTIDYTAAHVAVLLDSGGGAATLTQEGFRFRNDDGSESAATWAAAQDAGATAATGTTVRVRVLVDATGDPAATQYQLETKLSTDSTWTPVV